MNPVYDLIIKFSSLSSSRVIIAANPPKEGFCVENEELKMALNIFSDRNNNVYFEFKPKKPNTISIPTYLIDNFTYSKPILDKILSLYEENIQNNLPREQKYITLFKTLLKNKPLTIPYISKITENFLQIKDESINETIYIRIPSIQKLKEKAAIVSEPTSMLSLDIENIKYKQQPTTLYIPKYVIEEYPLLRLDSEFKNHTNLTTSFEYLIGNLKKTEEAGRTPFNDLVDYIILENTIPIRDDNTKCGTNKHKL